MNQVCLVTKACLAFVNSLSDNVFAVFVAELISRSCDVSENQPRADVLSKAQYDYGVSVVSQMLLAIGCFVKSGTNDKFEESDEVGAEKFMSTLIYLFKQLKDEIVKQASDNHRAGRVKKVIRSHLMKLMPNARAHHLAKLDRTHRVEEILNNVIQDCFCNYLDCKVLIVVVEELVQDNEDIEGTEHGQDTTELVLLLKSFQNKHKEFCQKTTLGVLRDALAKNSDFKPNKSVGTPFLVFQLSYPWLNLRYHTALSALTSILPLVSDLQLQAVEGTSDTVSLVYCGFEAPLVSLIADIQKPEVLKELKELKIIAKLENAGQPISAEPSTNAVDETSVDTDSDQDDDDDDEDDNDDDEKKKEKRLEHDQYDWSQDMKTAIMEKFGDMKVQMNAANSIQVLLGQTLQELPEAVKNELEAILQQRDDLIAQRFTNLSDQVKTLSTTVLKTKPDEIEWLHADINERTKLLEQREAEISRLSKRMEVKASQQRAKQDETNFQLAQLKQELQEQQDESNELKKLLEQREAEISRLSEQMEVKTSEQRAKQDKTNFQLAQLKQDLQEQHDECNELKKLLDQREAEISRLSEQMEVKASEQRAKQDETNFQLAQLKQDLQEQHDKSNELKKLLDQKDTKINRHSDQMEDMKANSAAELRAKQDIIDSQLAQLKHLEYLTKEHVERLQEQNTVIAQLAGSYSSLAIQLKESREENSAMDREAKDLRVQLRKYQQQGDAVQQCPQLAPYGSHLNHDATTLSPADQSPEGSLFYNEQVDDTAGLNITHSVCVTNNTTTPR